MSRRRVSLLAALSLGAAAFAALAPAALGRSEAKYTVTATDFKFKILPTVVRAGTHSFTLVNRGAADHDFKLGTKKTRILKAGRRQTIVVTLKKGRHAYLCTVPGHAGLGMKGTLVVR